MNRKVRFLQIAVALSVVLALALAGVSYAITISVDGVKEAVWDTGAGGQTPGIQTDLNEPTIDDRYDIKEFRWTNDSTGGTAPWGHMYFLVETYTALDTTYPPLQSTIIICLNSDNNATGATVSGYCNNMTGVDRKITVNLVTLSVFIQGWNGATWATVGLPPGGMRAVAYQDADLNGIADTPYIEIGVDLQSLGIIGSATCLAAMPTAIYYDNGMSDDEDQVLDSGTFNIGCGGPTAVTLSNLEARAADNNGTAVLILIGTATLVLGVVGTVALRRRKQHTL